MSPLMKEHLKLYCGSLVGRYPDSLVVEEDVGALDVSVQEVLLVAVVQPLQQLPHERLDVVLVEVDQAGLQQPHQVMVHVLKHQVERTCVLGEGQT